MSDLPRFKMDISYPSAEKPAFVRHIATNSGEWVRFVDAEKRIAELEAKCERYRAKEFAYGQMQAKLDAVRGVRDYCTDYPQYHKTVLKHVVAKLDAALGEDK